MQHNFSRILIFFMLCLPAQLALSQTYHFESGVPVQLGQQQQLQLPWTGGLNAVQASQADINGNGQPELLLYDRSSNQVQVFAQTTEGWVWLPEARFQFPEDITNWLLLTDYNGDGREDLFTYTAAGLRVFTNTAAAQQPAAWKLSYPLLTYPGSSSEVNLLVNSTDIPLIADTDGDGDVDIAAFDASGSGTIRWYKNVGVERFGRSDTLVYELAERHWGGITECECGELSLQFAPCPEKNGRTSQRPLHAGGKSLLWQDLSGDGVPDLLVGDEECNRLYYLPNTGTAALPAFGAFETGLPGAADETDFNFPAAYALGNDILISTNLKNAGQQMDLQQSLWLYEQQAQGAYKLVKKDHLQGQMLEVGEEARPALADMDGDGDLDLLLGSKGRLWHGVYAASLQLFENTGSTAAPAFQLKEPDFLGLFAEKYQQMQPQFADYDGNGTPDLLLTVLDVTVNSVRTVVYLNGAEIGAAASYQVPHTLELPLALTTLDYPYWYDVSRNGLLDALVGRFDGSLRLFTNIGTKEAPAFTLTDDGYKGFLLNNVHRHLIPTVGDANSDGQPDLLVSDARGAVRVLHNFLDEENAVDQSDWLMLAVGEDLHLPRLGDKSWPVLARLWAAERPALLVGQIGGGLVLLRNLADQLPPAENEFTLEVFPNPNNNQPVTIRVNVNSAVRVLNMLGQVVMQEDAHAQQPLLWQPQLPAGMFIVEARSTAGRKTRKLIVGP